MNRAAQYPHLPRRSSMLQRELARQYRQAHCRASYDLAKARNDAGFDAYYALLALIIGVVFGSWLGFALAGWVTVGLVRRGREAQEAMAIIAWAEHCLANIDRPSFADCHAKPQRS